MQKLQLEIYSEVVEEPWSEYFVMEQKKLISISSTHIAGS